MDRSSNRNPGATRRKLKFPSINSLKSPAPRPRRNLPRTSAALFQPLMKCVEFHRVLDRRISRQYAIYEILADVFNPTALADRTERERNGFIETFSGYFGRVLDSFGIADGDTAGTERHNGRVAYSPYIRQPSREDGWPGKALRHRRAGLKRSDEIPSLSMRGKALRDSRSMKKCMIVKFSLGSQKYRSRQLRPHYASPGLMLPIFAEGSAARMHGIGKRLRSLWEFTHLVKQKRKTQS